MNAFNYIIDKREPSEQYKSLLENIILSNEDSETTTSTREPQIIPLPHKIDGFLILDVISEQECKQIIDACENAGFTFWSNPASGNEVKQEQQQNEKEETKQQKEETSPPVSEEKKDLSQQGGHFRTAHTIEVNLPKMSKILWDRVAKLVNPVVNITQEDEGTYQRDLEGTWFADRFCYNLLFARYQHGGHFAPHVDGQSILTFNRRSMYSALFYLNDCEEGGETIFHAGDQCQALAVDNETGKVTGKNETALFKWKPKRGSCTIFRYDVLHEGAPVVPGKQNNIKYIIRGDVEFERKPPVCDDENGRRAFELYERARKMEAEGDTDGAVKLFRMIRKVSPELAAIYQLM